MRGFAKVAAIACLWLTAGLGTAPIAFSQEDGVTLDPGDPAAKEYALPHEEARREAGAAPNAPVEPGTRDSALFGAGVRPDGATTPEAPDAPTTDQGNEPTPTTVEGTGDTDGSTDDASEPSAAASSSSSGGGSGIGATTALLGGGAAALFVALLGGLGLRAVRSPRDA